jgi:hypothetical protein
MTKNITIIDPIAFRSEKKGALGKGTPPLKWLMPLLVIIGLLLIYVIWFVFTAPQVEVHVEPVPDRIFIKGGLMRIRFGNDFLLRPGDYILNAFKKGYHPIEKPFTVKRDSGQRVHLVMEKLPGLLTLNVHESNQPDVEIEGAAVTIDGQAVGEAPLMEKEVKPGLRQLRITAAGYQDLEHQLTVEGMGQIQSVSLGLLPVWAQIGIRSVPIGAVVQINGEEKGVTPLETRLDAGEYDIRISAENYKSWQSRLVVQANQPRILDLVTLQPADGRLELNSKPPGANVTIDNAFAGRTPLVVPLSPEIDHRVQFSKAGYAPAEQIVNLVSDGQQSLTLTLEPRYGTIHFDVHPAGTRLVVDGQERGDVPKNLRLVAVEHVLEIKKQGYQTYRKKITPRPGLPQELRVALKKEGTVRETAPGIIVVFNGYRLKRIQPESFTLGSSRREQGRRSNETLRPVVLKIAFYIGQK